MADDLESKLDLMRDAILAMQDQPLETVDFQAIARVLCRITDGLGAIVNVMDSGTGRVRTAAIHIEEGTLTDRVVGLLGFDPVGRTWKLDADTRERLWTDRLVVLDGLYGLSFGQVPRLVCRSLEQILGIGTIWAIGLTSHGEAIGGAAFALRRGRDLRFPALVESFARTIGLLYTRLSTAKELTDERARLAATLRSIRDAVFAVDEPGSIVLANPAAERLLGMEPARMRGRNLDGILYCTDESGEALPAGFWRSLLEPDAPSLRATLVNAAGECVPVAIQGAPLDHDGRGAVLVLRDVRDEERIERDARNKERLESLGVLAGGIAHDFNNMLTALLGNLDLARSSLDHDGETASLLEEACKAAVQAQGLTRQLLTFSKGGAPVKQTASLAELVRDTVEFIRRGTATAVSYSFPPDLRPVEADPAQLSQVVQNLCLNAIEAMDRGGSIDIAARNATVGRGDSLPPGEYIRLSVRDSGPGIPRDVLPRIFDPFFTTKSGGSGLGLPTSYSILHRHGGKLQVESPAGGGAVFHVVLPAAKTLARKEPVTAPRGFRAGRILVMDDDEAIRRMLGRLLSRLGYASEAVADGQEAVRRYREERGGPAPFSAVILDLTVPGGMGGKEALERIRALDPSARAIVSSGYYDDALISSPDLGGFDAVASKPYRTEDLSRTLQEVLARTEGD